ncbi:hypothetical protein SAMN04244571_03119 [Azotobacter beijerinckii]|uniref:Lipoprotein n=1 Tax=Azotobacter beijerinckii TaxID=170623 RepID=A0A1I1BDG8_9GAMM|nr:hypothetical protein SAMN04244571_03119 [Azotobacter beijerinckii]
MIQGAFKVLLEATLLALSGCCLKQHPYPRVTCCFKQQLDMENFE